MNKKHLVYLFTFLCFGMPISSQEISYNQDFRITSKVSGFNDDPSIKNQSVLLSDSIQLDWVQQLGGEELEGGVLVKSSTADLKGNFYVIGNIKNKGIFCIKYNKDGEIQWKIMYSETGTEECTAIKIDACENLIITGFCQSDSAGYDFLTIKYNSNGSLQWARIYNGPADLMDKALEMAIDKSCNIYISGESAGSESSGDIVTIKYDSSGNLLWEQRYNGPANSSDEPTDITIDSRNNIYICGYSTEILKDIITLKYNSAGEFKWDYRYNNPYNNDDVGKAIVCDNFGNIYVAGTSVVGRTNDFDRPWEIYSMALLKYDSLGISQWVRTSDRLTDAADIVVDHENNVIVGGYDIYTYHAEDVIPRTISTIKYDGSGNELWAKQYPPSSSYTIGLTVDALNNIYIAGSDYVSDDGFVYVLIKYNADGVKQWTSHANGPGPSLNTFPIAVEKYNNNKIFITGNGGNSYFNVAFDSSGTELWRDVNLFTYTTRQNTAKDFVHDKEDNIYITGIRLDNRGFNDIVIAKYNNEGEQQWLATPSFFGSIAEEPIKIIYDGMESLYIGAKIYYANAYTFALLKYNLRGQKKWIKEGLFQPGEQYITDMVLDKNNNIVVSGYNYGIYADNDFLTAKYDFDGNLLWIINYPNPINYPGSSLGTRIAISDDNSIIIAGSNTNADSIYEMILLKYDPYGSLIWSSKLSENYNNNENQILIDLVLDSSENIYIVSEKIKQDESSDILLVKFDPFGRKIWQTLFNGSDDADDRPKQLLLNAQDQIIVVGESKRIGSDCDYLTMMYNSSGGLRWYAYYNGKYNLSDTPASVTLDSIGNIYITGKSMRQDSTYSIATVMYDSTGLLIMEIVYSNSESINDMAEKIVLSREQDILILGNSNGPDWNDITLLKYKYLSDSNPDSTQSIHQFKLRQNYPNPFNSGTKIIYSLPIDTFAEIIVYDILGRKVRSLFSGYQKSGEYFVELKAEDLASGIYIFQLKTPTFTTTKKGILIK